MKYRLSSLQKIVRRMPLWSVLAAACLLVGVVAGLAAVTPWAQFHGSQRHAGTLNQTASDLAPTNTDVVWVLDTDGTVRSSAAVIATNELPSLIQPGATGTISSGSTTLAVSSKAGLHIGDQLLVGDEYLGPITAISADSNTVTVTYAAVVSHTGGGLTITLERSDILQGVVAAGATTLSIRHPEVFHLGDRLYQNKGNGEQDAYLGHVTAISGTTLTIDKALPVLAAGDIILAGLATPAETSDIGFVGSDDGYLYAFNPAKDADANASTVSKYRQLFWKASAGGQLGAVRGTPAVDAGNGRVYVNGLSGRLFAFSVSGEFLWAYPALDQPALGETSGGPVVDEDGNVYFAALGGAKNGNTYTGPGVYKINQDGKLDGYAALGTAEKPGQLVLYKKDDATTRLVFGVTDLVAKTGKVYNLSTGMALIWQYDTVAGVNIAPVVDVDGNIYVAETSGLIHALAETTDAGGQPTASSLWQLSAGESVTSLAVTADTDIANRVLYAARAQGKLCAIPLVAAGAPSLQDSFTALDTGEYVTGPLTLDANGKVLAATSMGKVYCYGAFNAGVNTPVWNPAISTYPIRTAPTLAANNAIVGSDDGFVYGIGTATGAPVTTDPSTVYFPSGDWPFFHRDVRHQGSLAEPGSQLFPGPWQPMLRWFAAHTDTSIRTSPVVTENTPDGKARVYVGNEEGRLYAYDASTGEELWRYPAADAAPIGPIRATPAVNKDGLIAVTALDGYLYLINPSGSLKQRINLGDTGTDLADATASPVFNADGSTVYTATTDRLVNALGKYDSNGAGSLTGGGITLSTSGYITYAVTDANEQMLITHVRIYTKDAGVLNVYRDKDDTGQSLNDLPIVSRRFDSVAEARYLDIELSIDAQKIEWRSLTNNAVVKAFDVYAAGSMTALTTLDTPRIGTKVTASSDADNNGTPDVLWAHQLTVTSEVPYRLSVIDEGGNTISWGSYAASNTDANTGNLVGDEIRIDRRVTGIVWENASTDPAKQDIAPTLSLTVRDFTESGGRVYAFSTTDGGMVWKYPTANYTAPVSSSPLVATTAGNDIVYIANVAGQVYALNSSGNLFWSGGNAVRGFFYPFYASPVLDKKGDYLAIPDFGGTVHLIRLSDGATAAGSEKVVVGPCSNTMAVTGTGQAYLISDLGFVYLVNVDGTKNTDPRYLTTLPTAVYSSPVIDSVGRVYFGSESGALYCLEPGTGQVTWTYLPDRSTVTTKLLSAVSAGTTLLPVAAVDTFRVGDTVMISRPDGSEQEPLGKVLSLIPMRNSTVLTAEANSGDTVITVASIDDIQVGDTMRILPVANAGETEQAERVVGQVTAIDTQTNKVTLNQGLPALPYAYHVNSVVSVGYAQPMMVVSQAPSKYRTQGDTITYQTGMVMPIRTSPAIGPSQTVYIGAEDGVLYAVGPTGPAGTPSALPALPVTNSDAPWWTFHRDNQRTGFSTDPGPLTNGYRWYRNTGGTLESSPALGYADGTAPLGVLYVGTTDQQSSGAYTEARGALIAYNASNGRIRWRFDNDGQMGRVFSSPAVFTSDRDNGDGTARKDEYVVFGTEDLPEFATAKFEGVLLNNGNARTQVAKDETITHVYVNDVSTFRVGMQIYITDAGSGSNLEVLGTIKSISAINDSLELSSPFTAQRDHLAGAQVTAQTSQQGHVYCVNRQGELQWMYPPSTAASWERIGAIHSSPVVSTHLDDQGGTVTTIYIGTDDGMIYALNTDGTKRWEYMVELPKGVAGVPSITSSPTLSQDETRLFVGVSVSNTNRGYLLALDTVTANDERRVLWMQGENGTGGRGYLLPITASPTVTTIDQKEYVFVGEEDLEGTDATKYFYAFNADDGAVVAREKAVPTDATNTPLFPASDGTGCGSIVSTAAAISEGAVSSTQVMSVDRTNGGQQITVASVDGFEDGMAVKLTGVGSPVTGNIVTINRNSRVVTLNFAVPAGWDPLDTSIMLKANRPGERVVVVGTLNGYLLAYDLNIDLTKASLEDRMSLAWYRQTRYRAPIRTSPAISMEVGEVGTTSDNVHSYTAYFGANDHYLYAVRFYGDQVVRRWERNMRDRVFASPVVGMRTYAQGRAIIYQASRDHYIYAIGDQTNYDGEPTNPNGPNDGWVPDEDKLYVPSTIAVSKTVERANPASDDKAELYRWKFTVTVRDSGRGQVKDVKVYDLLPDALCSPEPPVIEPDAGGLADEYRMVARVTRPITYSSTGNDSVNDLCSVGKYTGTVDRIYRVRVNPDADPVTPGKQETYMWSVDGGGWQQSATPIAPGATIDLEDGIQLIFYGNKHSGNEQWLFRVYAYHADDPTKNKESWEIHWSNYDADADASDAFGDGFVLNPNLGDPAQSPYEYQRRLVFTLRVKESYDPYKDTDVSKRPVFHFPDDPNRTKIDDKTPLYRLGEIMRLTLLNHPAANLAQGVNKLYAEGLMYLSKTKTMPLRAYTETPVSSDWTDSFVVRLYYNGFEKAAGGIAYEGYLENGELPSLTALTNLVHPFSAWNQVSMEDGSPLHFTLPYTMTGRSATGTTTRATSDFPITLRPVVRPFTLVRGSAAGSNYSVLPYDWRITIQQGKARMNKRIILWGDEVILASHSGGDFARDFILDNPVKVSASGNKLTELSLGDSVVPGHTATSPTITVKNDSLWSAQPYTLMQRFLVSPIDLSHSSPYDWNGELAAANGYSYGGGSTAGTLWDGFRYDPYRENHVAIRDGQLDVPSGVGLTKDAQFDLHFTRPVSAFQADSASGSYRTEKMSEIESSFRGAAVGFKFDDADGDTAWDPGEIIYRDLNNNGKRDLGEPTLAPSTPDTRFFVDYNSNLTWDTGEPFYAYGSLSSGTAPSLPLTEMGVAVKPTTRMPNTVLDLGRFSLASTYAIPSVKTILENTGNKTISGGSVRASSDTLTTDGTGGTLNNWLMRTGMSSSRFTGTAITQRSQAETQPFWFTAQFPVNWILQKSPVEANASYWRPFPLTVPGVSNRQPTGTYTGRVTVASGLSTDSAVVTTRVSERRFSQVAPGLTTDDPRPAFDQGKGGPTGWTNYLTGAESWPTAAVIGMNANEADDLGVWVASNTPQVDTTSTTLTDLVPQENTDTNIWFRRAKYLTTEVTQFNGNTVTLATAGMSSRVRTTTEPSSDAATADLIILRKKPTTFDEPVVEWYARASAKDTANNTITLQAISGWNWTYPASQTVIDVVSHPWVPLFTTATLDLLRDGLKDPGVPGDTGPRPIRCTTPSATPIPGGSKAWLTWSVNAVRTITQDGKKETVPFSYLAYKLFDAANPTAGGFQWVSPLAAKAVKPGDPAPLTVREKPVFLSDVAGYSGMVLYEGAGDAARGLYYATTTSPLQNAGVQTKVDWKIDQPLTAINQAFASAGRPQMWVDQDAGGNTALNLIFQGRRADGNVDLYFAQAQVSAQGLQLAARTNATTETLTPDAGKTFFSGASNLAWAAGTQFTVTLSDGSTHTFTPSLIEMTREYDMTSATTPTLRVRIDPYRATVRIVQLPAGTTVSKVEINGKPCVQRLTTNVYPDVNPSISVERWRYYGAGLLGTPRIWVYWTRQHDDGLGSRVYYRTWRYDATKMMLMPETRQVAADAVDVPERMLPMEVYAQDGSIFVTRQSAATPSENSPEAGLWILSTAARSVFPPYPDLTKINTNLRNQPVQQDLFLQVMDEPVPDK